MGQGARCRSDSGPPLSCIRWNRPEYRCHRAILSPNAANPTTCAKDLSGPAAGCWTAAATLAAFFEGWRQAPGNGPHGAAVQKHRPRVHFRFQRPLFCCLPHEPSVSEDEVGTKCAGRILRATTLQPTVQLGDRGQPFALWCRA